MKFLTDADAARAVVPRPAATTLVVRDAAAEDGAAGVCLEVLMVRRSLQASFMPGAYVFPGGAVDAADESAAALACCDEPAAALASRIGEVTEVGAKALGFAVGALRECFEECGLWLMAHARATPPAEQLLALRARLHGGEPFPSLASEAGWPLCTSVLQTWSHWVTPLGVPKRFDTLFFVAQAPLGQVPSVDAGETTTLAWVHPPAALAAHARGEFPMEFATVRTVESLVPWATRGAASLLRHAVALRHVPPLHPRLHLGPDGHPLGILLPGQPGYEEHGLR